MQKVVKNCLLNRKFRLHERLSTKAQFSDVFRDGVKFVTSSFVFYYKENTLGYSRIGIIVGKRAAKRAVDRHRLKRKVREAFRLSKPRLGARDIVVIARRYDANKPLSMEAHWDRLCKRFQI